jgi:hypothetical protein
VTENRGYGPAGMQTKDGYERSVAALDAAQARLDEQVAACRYCKAAKTRAHNKVKYTDDADALAAAFARADQAECKEHRSRRRLNYVTSPVSETYWST